MFNKKNGIFYCNSLNNAIPTIHCQLFFGSDSVVETFLVLKLIFSVGVAFQKYRI